MRDMALQTRIFGVLLVFSLACRGHVFSQGGKQIITGTYLKKINIQNGQQGYAHSAAGQLHNKFGSTGMPGFTTNTIPKSSSIHSVIYGVGTTDHVVHDVTTQDDSKLNQNYDTIDNTQLTTSGNPWQTPSNDQNYDTIDDSQTQTHLADQNYDTIDDSQTGTHSPDQNYDTIDDSQTETHSPDQNYDTIDDNQTETHSPDQNYDTIDDSQTETHSPDQNYDTIDDSQTETHSPDQNYDTDDDKFTGTSSLIVPISQAGNNDGLTTTTLKSIISTKTVNPLHGVKNGKTTANPTSVPGSSTIRLTNSQNGKSTTISTATTASQVKIGSTSVVLPSNSRGLSNSIIPSVAVSTGLSSLSTSHGPPVTPPPVLPITRPTGPSTIQSPVLPLIPPAVSPTIPSRIPPMAPYPGPPMTSSPQPHLPPPGPIGFIGVPPPPIPFGYIGLKPNPPRPLGYIGVQNVPFRPPSPVGYIGVPSMPIHPRPAPISYIGIPSLPMPRPGPMGYIGVPSSGYFGGQPMMRPIGHIGIPSINTGFMVPGQREQQLQGWNPYMHFNPNFRN